MDLRRGIARIFDFNCEDNGTILPGYKIWEGLIPEAYRTRSTCLSLVERILHGTALILTCELFDSAIYMVMLEHKHQKSSEWGAPEMVDVLANF